jgi:hypothetical protein
MRNNGSSPRAAVAPAVNPAQKRPSTRQARPLTRLQEALLVSVVLAIGGLLQLLVILNATGMPK